MTMNEQQPVENNNENRLDSNTWRQVAIGGVSGIALGAMATAAYAAATGHTEGPHGQNHPTNGEEGSHPSIADSTIEIAEVSNDMSFGEAFAAARAQVGPGGVFVWHGQAYTTYYAEEWNSMTPAERNEFGSHLNIPHSNSSTASNTHTGHQEAHAEAAANNQTASGTSSQSSSQQQTQTNTQTTTQETGGTTNTSGQEHATGHEPTVEVVSFEEIEHADSSHSDMAILNIDGEVVGLMDIDQDGTADLLIQDANGDQQIAPDEMEDVSDLGIAMQPFREEYIAQQDSSIDTDYINDGDVQSYMG